MNSPYKTGTLNLEISTDNGASWTAIWGKSGNQGDEWKSETMNLRAYVGKRIQLRFVGHTNTYMWANIAVDDLLLNTEGSCTAGDITLDITFDNYPEETSWELKDSEGNIIDSASYTAADTPDGSNFNKVFANLPTGNYTFTIKDRIGDGICCSYGEGSYSLSSASGLIASGGEFGREESITFCVQNNATSAQASRGTQIVTHDLSKSSDDYTVYPVPADKELQVRANGKTKEATEAMIFSMYGRKVKQVKMTPGKAINIADLPAGTYFIRILSGDKTVTKKFIKH
jgi:hypothetical protein